MADKLSLLKRYWGYDSFRPLQEQIIDSVLGSNDTLALLPTGGGKSLCYQLPTLMTEGLCLVVSPLIALMKDQVQQLNNRKIKAACIVSGMSSAEADSVLANAMSGTLKFLYVSPERLQQRKFIEHFRRMKVSLIAIDEAHCVSQWGYDFRPPYLQIAEIRAYHPAAPMMALTATATPEVADDIVAKLMMRNPKRFRSTFARANLTYSVVHGDNKIMRTVNLIQKTEGSGIVYTRSRKATKEIADQLTDAGISATYYHAGLTADERDKRQGAWMDGHCRVMVATNAFGMGIDKASVRFVIHFDIPDSLEAYFQEAGRAGRDGKPADAYLLYGSADDRRLESAFASEYPTLKYIRNVYRALGNYYKLPLGSGADSHFNFDMEELCSTYNFMPREFYSACRFLEREGLIMIPDREEASSTLFFPLGRNEMYHFQVNHERLGGLLQCVIRLYPGVSTEAIAIDEKRIASRFFAEPTDVIQMLNEMKAMHVVEYTPRSTKPQIIFTSPRINEGDIYLSEEHYSMLKEAARRRLQAVHSYLACDNVCRSRQLLAYFGESEGVEDCGRCDVCHNRSNTDIDITDSIKKLLTGRSLQVNDICRLLDTFDKKRLTETLRTMLDQGELQSDSDMRLSLS